MFSFFLIKFKLAELIAEFILERKMFFHRFPSCIVFFIFFIYLKNKTVHGKNETVHVGKQ